MGATRQIATRQINRFITVFSFEITRSRQHTTDGKLIQAGGLSQRRQEFPPHWND